MVDFPAIVMLPENNLGIRSGTAMMTRLFHPAWAVLVDVGNPINAALVWDA